MTALVQGSDGVLAVTEVARPEPGPGEVLVRVRCAGINRADLAQRAGMYPPPPGVTDVLGLEVSGEVVALGDGLGWGVAADPQPEAPGVAEGTVVLQPGVPVCALLPGGGYAEYAVVPAALLMPVPTGWSMVEAAAWPETAFTAFLNLFVEARLKRGERLLVHGGASGVGTMAIAMAVAAGASVFATAGGPEKVNVCTRLGAELVIDRHTESFANVIDACVPPGVDVVLDMVGRAYFADNLGVLRAGGRLVVIATLSGAEVEVDLRRLMAKRAHLIGSTLRGRSVAEKIEVKRALWHKFGAQLAAGSLKPVIDQVHPWRDADVAHERMRANRNAGKLVLELE